MLVQERALTLRIRCYRRQLQVPGPIDLFVRHPSYRQRVQGAFCNSTTLSMVGRPECSRFHVLRSVSRAVWQTQVLYMSTDIAISATRPGRFKLGDRSEALEMAQHYRIGGTPEIEMDVYKRGRYRRNIHTSSSASFTHSLALHKPNQPSFPVSNHQFQSSLPSKTTPFNA